MHTRYIRDHAARCMTDKLEDRVWGPETQPEWARRCPWDTHDISNCVPLLPFSENDPPLQGAIAGFFTDWGEHLGWPDKDMIHQVSSSGIAGRSACAQCTVIGGHHGGLRHKPEPVAESIEADTSAERQWISPGRLHPHTVPVRLAPKNVVAQHKWRIVEGQLQKVVKWRVTTNDSHDA